VVDVTPSLAAYFKVTIMKQAQDPSLAQRKIVEKINAMYVLLLVSPPKPSLFETRCLVGMADPLDTTVIMEAFTLE